LDDAKDALPPIAHTKPLATSIQVAQALNDDSDGEMACLPHHTKHGLESIECRHDHRACASG